MINEKQIKIDLQELIDDFKEHYEQYKKELEANTETKLIEPLFEILGWTKKDYEKQAKARRGKRLGHADYAFYIGDKIVFFLEVKKVGIPLEREADKQVISYALSKRVSFAVSTNFEELKIFCVEQEDALRNKFRVFNSPDEYLTNFNDLLFLSKESFEQGLTLKKAEGEGRLKRRASIDKALLEDLMHIRSLIATDLEKNYPEKYEINEKDEIIQRIIDRLIFIRRCEDTGINPENLTLKEAMSLPDNKAYPKLKEIFKTYNDVYNSGLFIIAKDNDCDKITIDGEIIKKLARYLYESKDGKYIYNFDWIDADVLGQVYEQYLGKLLAQTRSGKAKLTNGQAHRKEQGIYYTPTYIVDYIVKNTVGELLKNKKIKVKDLKILDPACGSGSFLIKAFDYLYDNLSSGKDSKQYRIDSQGKYSIKTEILKNNIYGVDLDQKAVEITKLNLLLKAAEKNRRLPEEIDMCIKHGNSLIDDETVAGMNAFKWEDNFKEITKKGGFDVVIGNPPYIKVGQIKKEEKEWIFRNFKNATGRTDLYILFLEKALNLVKDGGYVSFIIPDIWIKAKYGKILRKTLLENYQIKVIIDFGDLKVFESATTYPCIILIKKKKPTIKNSISFYKVPNLTESIIKNLSAIVKTDSQKIKQVKFDWNFGDPETKKLFEKINNSSKIKLGDIRDQIYEGFITGDNKVFFVNADIAKSKKLEKEILKPVPKGKNIRRYSIKWNKEYVIYPYLKNGEKIEPINLSDFPNVKSYLLEFQKKLISRTSIQGTNKKWFEHVRPRKKWWFEKSKILTPNLSSKNNFAIDEGHLNEYFYVDHDAYAITLKSNNQKRDLSYICGVLNSKLMEFFIKQISPMFSGGYYKYHTQYLDPIPIIEPKTEVKSKFIEMVDKMILLNKHLNEIGDKKTSETAKLEEGIKKTDNEIDQLVYKLYCLTKKEINIVEESLKG